MRHLVSALGLALVTLPATAATTDGKFSVRGLGGASCQALSTALQGPDAASVTGALTAWISGYLTGLNQGEPQTFDAMPVTQDRVVAMVVVSTCTKNPTLPVQAAVGAIVAGFAPAVAHSAGPMVATGPAASHAALHGEALAAVQDKLVALGLMKAPANRGQMDDKTTKALTAFQTAHQVPVTGIPDDLTLMVLFQGA